MKKITLGHHLFQKWAADMGGQKNNPNKPSTATLDEIRRMMNRRCKDIQGYRFIKQINGMWFWLEDTSSPVKPIMAYRRAIKRVTKKHVPIDSWEIKYRGDS
mgnify:FL=1|tara:strand:- start:3372 stop:3677 length:306 start_codon:yes stop_codon:yes gene_type:complete